MFLPDHLKTSIDNRLKKDLPKHADYIISERREIKKYLIKRLVCLDEVAIWPGTFGWRDHACIIGDEYDAISVCFTFKAEANRKGIYLDSFGREVIDA